MAIKLFADGANLDGIKRLAADTRISGFTTNPSLMRKAGVTDYERFARDALQLIGSAPISLEVFADDPREMRRQAYKIASWGENVYVKIPVMTTDGTPTTGTVAALAEEGVKVNVTAILDVDRQVPAVLSALQADVPAYVSVFAGRIADTGVDPVGDMLAAVHMLRTRPQAELIWASPRQVLDIWTAQDVGCHIITITPDLLNKLHLRDRNLLEYSRDTVAQFYNDAAASGFQL